MLQKEAVERGVIIINRNILSRKMNSNQLPGIRSVIISVKL